jgi:hypothetical protein
VCRAVASTSHHNPPSRPLRQQPLVHLDSCELSIPRVEFSYLSALAEGGADFALPLVQGSAAGGAGPGPGSRNKRRLLAGPKGAGGAIGSRG